MEGETKAESEREDINTGGQRGSTRSGLERKKKEKEKGMGPMWRKILQEFQFLCIHLK